MDISKIMKEHQAMRDRLVEIEEVYTCTEQNDGLRWASCGELIAEGEASKFVKVVWFKDEKRGMEMLEVDGECVGYGNNCHCEDRANGIISTFDALGIKYVFSVDRTWNPTYLKLDR